MADALPEEVWRRIQARVELSLAGVESAATALLDGPLEATARMAAEGQAAMLGDWLDELGLGTGSNLARKMREAVAEARTGAREAVLIAGLAEELRAALGAMPFDLPPTAAEAPLVAVIGPASPRVDVLLWVAVTHGLRVVHRDSASGGAGQADEPSAVLFVGDVSGCGLHLPVARERFPAAVAVAVVDDLTDDGRLALRRVAHTILDGSASPQQVVSEVRRAIVLAADGGSIALVGATDDLLGRELRRRALGSVTDVPVDHLPDAIRAGADTIVIGPAVADPLALAAIQTLRADPGTRHAVIIRRGADAGGGADFYRHGADAVVAPDEDPQVVAAMVGMLRRRHRLVPQAERPGRRLMAWPMAQVFAERMLHASVREDRATSLAVVALPPREDPAELDAVQDDLATEFRTDDLVSRLDAHRQVVVLQGVNRRTALRRVHLAIERVGLRRVGARAGIAEFPYDGRTIDELLRLAGRAVMLAHEASGPVAVGADWPADTGEAVDVLIVEAEPLLTEVLTAHLGDRGITSVAFADGLDALQELAHERRYTPRAVVLDFDSPGIDGLQLLRRLREAGVMNRFRVMMTSASERESDLRTAFELGAAEVVTKPFSAVVFVNRLRRLLDA